ncbi:MAG: UvrD-helicase domain-containing protein [Erysipelotrichaceae bacterium]|nr:UvrD-helicase domain-containing protein [Erysipelotrichaceae bacterium]
MVNINDLNVNQKEAVLTNDRYVRIIAGAGSGKTRVLVMRIAHLINDRNVFPNKILAITFTNKAANEMKERIRKTLNDENISCWISTIHSLCVRILREDISSLGYPRNFTVMDSDDQRTVLKEAYKIIGLDSQKYSYGSMLDYISNNKSAEISVDRAIELSNGFKGDLDKAKVYEYYIQRQKEMYALDFDDLLLFTVRLFKKYPDILRKWMKRFNYIHVDEFQDIDKVQYELIGLLTGYENELYVVGDPDQTIYTWRGADVNIIMNFEKDFKPCHTIILNENYRSTSNILNGANSVIKNNTQRVEKDLFTNRINNEKITHNSLSSDEAEARWIAEEIRSKVKSGKKYKDFAILYRSNYLSRSIEKGLLEEKIPYVIFGGVRFYDRAEIKDALSYMRLVCNSDDLSFNRIINKPKRGIGAKTIETILNKAREENLTMYETIKRFKLFSKKTQSEIDNFVNLIEKMREKMNLLEIDKFLEFIIDESGYRNMLEEEKEVERIENIKELISDVNSFKVEYPESDVNEYLQMVSLYGDKEENKNGEYVSLMTVHASKGLEFDTVFVCGLSDGVFPSERSMAEGRKGVEEERRIAYVAFTRAQNKLYLSDSSGFSYVLSKARVTSRFINEIDEDFIEHLEAPRNDIRQVSFYDSTTNEVSYSPIKSQTVNKAIKIKKGDKVKHKLFGEGIVIKIEASIAHIAFKHPHNIKKIAANHPSIEKINLLS